MQQFKSLSWQTLPFLALMFISLFVAGCGGSHSPATSDTSSANVSAKGKLSLSVVWPNTSQTQTTSHHAPKDIPKATQSITVEVLLAGAIVETGTIERGSGVVTDDKGTTTGTLTLTAIPAGTVTIRVKAFSESGGKGDLLASGENIVQIQPIDTNKASVNLSGVPAPVTTDAYILGGSVAPDPDHPGQIKITLSALINRADGTPVTGLTADNFVVLEDGIQRGPLQVGTTAGGKSKADIAFAIDTTGSMSPEIDGVKNSVVSLAQSLAASGVDVRFAGDSFGDEIRGTFDFTSDPAAFQSWVNTLSADGGGDIPENSLDAITHLSDSLTWRPDAQRIVIVITDAPSHQADDGTDFTTQTSDSVAKRLAGKYVVDAISPGLGISPSFRQSYGAGLQVITPDFQRHLKPRAGAVQPVDVQAVANGTGGRWVQLPSDGKVDLTALPIGQTILNGYLIGYPSATTNTDHQVRVVVSIGGNFVADQNFTGHY